MEDFPIILDMNNKLLSVLSRTTATWPTKTRLQHECETLQALLISCDNCVGAKYAHSELSTSANFLKNSLSAILARITHAEGVTQQLGRLRFLSSNYRRQWKALWTCPDLGLSLLTFLSAFYSSVLSSLRDALSLIRQFEKVFPLTKNGSIDEAALYCLQAHKLRYGHSIAEQPLEAFRLYDLAAQLGSVEALTCCGALLEELNCTLTGTERDAANGNPSPPYLTRTKRFQQAKEYYEKASSAGFPDAAYRLARLKEGEAGIEPDAHGAALLYKQAAECGHSEAQAELGYIYETGKVPKFPQDFSKAFDWYSQAAAQKSARGLNNLGSMMFRGIGCSQDQQEAAQLFKLAAELGNTNAHFNLGVCYEFAKGVQQEDSDAASRLYKFAAREGHTKAASSLGFLLLRLACNCEEQQQVYFDASRWLMKAADEGDAESAFHLGEMYEAGLGVQRDVKQALGYYQKAAQTGCLKGHTRIAHILYSGANGDETVDPTKAFQHYVIASATGEDGESINCLGMCYEQGYGNKKGLPDFQKASECYEKAVALHSVEAMCNLSRLCYKGLGMRKDTARAFSLLKIAASKGSVEARIALEKDHNVVPPPLLDFSLNFLSSSSDNLSALVPLPEQNTSCSTPQSSNHEVASDHDIDDDGDDNVSSSKLQTNDADSTSYNS